MVTIIGVGSQDRNGNTLEKTEKMVADKGDTMGYTVAWDNERATTTAFMTAAKQNGIPCSFVVDKGRQDRLHRPPDVPGYLVLDKVIAGKWDAKAGNAEVKKVEDQLYGEEGVYAQSKSDPAAALKTFNSSTDQVPQADGRQDRPPVPAAVRNGRHGRGPQDRHEGRRRGR